MPGSFHVKRGSRTGIEVRPEAVREARREAGLSLAQVASGQVTRAAIHLVETGRMRPSMRTLELIARRTGRPVTYFLAGPSETEEQRSDRNRLEQYVEVDDFESAIALGTEMLEQDLSAPLEAEVHYLLATCYMRRHDGERALKHARNAREFFANLGDALMCAETIDVEATAFLLLDDPRALPTALRALQLCEELQPPAPGLRVRILLHLGSICHRQGDWNSAARFYEQGLEAAKLAPNPRHIAMMHDGLNVAYQSLGRYAAALEQARHAFRLYRMDRDPRSQMRAELNLGGLLVKQGQLDAGESHLLRALQLCEQLGIERWGRTVVLCDLAEVDIVRGRYGDAHRRLVEAEGLARKHGEWRTEAIACQLQGRLHLRQGQDAKAEQAFDRAIELFRRLEMPERLRDCLIEFAEALQERGQLERSLLYWREAAMAGRLAGMRSGESVMLLGATGA